MRGDKGLYSFLYTNAAKFPTPKGRGQETWLIILAYAV